LLNLSEEEIIDITGKLRHDAQARELRHLGIDFRTRSDGSHVVSRLHYEKSLGGIPEKPVRVKTAPNWSAL
jgi:hypothetical protein